MKRKSVLFGLVILLGGFFAGWFFWPSDCERFLRLPGIVEIQEVRLGSKVGGRVARTLIAEGDLVYPGQELVIFEIPELENQHAQLRAVLEAARADLLKAENGPRPEEKQVAADTMKAAWARYTKIKNGWRPEEKQQVLSELATARAELVRAAKDLERIGRLQQVSSATQSDYETATAARDKAQGQLNAARAKNEMYQSGSRLEDISEAFAEWKKARSNYELLKKGTRVEDIALARAHVAEADAKLKEVETHIKEGIVSVPRELGKGVVEVLSVRPGDLVAPNTPIIRVLRADDLWVKVFIPETQLGVVPLGKFVQVTVDALPNRPFRGQVIQKASISEFTPRNVQSLEERRYQVFALKIRVDDAQATFNAGMAAEVLIPVE